MLKKRGLGRPPKVKQGRPKGSKNKIIRGLKEAIEWSKGKDNGTKITQFEYVKDYPVVASLRSRLEASVIKFENTVNEMIEQLKGKL